MKDKINIKYIAQKAEVSTATVSYVINNTGNISEDTRNKVLKVLEEYNFKPNRIAKSLRVSRTNTIGIIVEDLTVFHVPWIINGINKYAESNEYNIILSDLRLVDRIQSRFEDINLYRNKINEAIDIILSAKVDGIIYVSMHDRKIEGVFQNIGLPIVYVYCYTEDENNSYITYENENISYEATKYLIENGHKKIAVISGTENSMPSQKRMMGYQKALKDSGLELRSEYMKIGDWKYELGFKMCNELMQLRDRPTAIFAMNDVMALGALEAAHSNNIKVPDELSIIGFDNTESSFYSYPKLTTVELPFKEMGYTAAEILDKKVKKEAINNNSVIFPCKLIKRASVTKIV